MKTAEEWMHQFGKFPNDNETENKIYSLAKLPEHLLPKVNFWNSVLTESDIQQIQLDAYKAGMTEAHTIQQSFPPSEHWECGKSILSARDKKETI